MSVFDDMVKFLDTTWIAKDVIVPCMEGPTGIGKTAAVHKHAENVGANKVVTIIASQILPNEVSGITMPDASSKAMEIYDHFRLSSLEDGDILFFDELLEADQLVLSACLTLIESRQMMSGKMLPDIQIIAATNPTIKPNMLKENIRQRFVWQKFDLDRAGCREYIEKTYGFDVGMTVVSALVTTGNEYNILTPRSLTKMAAWISSAKDIEEARLVGNMIDRVWSCNIGTAIYKAYAKAIASPEQQVRSAVSSMLNDMNYTDVDIDECTTMTELVDLLSGLPDWEEIKDKLSNMEVHDDKDVDVLF